MRTVQGCNIHQSLTRDAATIVKQAIHLARRRGHAQVTPIHVATVMLASPAGLLRSACLNNSHPYQCKALELCFNVALNRLPATFNHSHSHSHSHYYPSLANALMAAFKRAQAHQRRGSADAQQQPILALKIETDQLVISILDDPSVSRVMREAGFSSTLLKSTLLLDHNHIHNHDHNSNSNSNIKVVSLSSSPFDLSFSSSSNALTRSEDVSSVVDQWVKRIDKSSVVVVGECLGSCEGVVRGVRDRVQRGDVPFELRYLQFLNCPLSSMKNMSREEIDMKLGEIRCLLKGCVGRGVVLYLGDLKWMTQYMVMGLRRLVFGNVEKGRIWLMGISTFNSYINCKSGNPSLETMLDLLPLTIPSPTLDLTLNLNSNKSCVTTTNCSLPSWLQKCNKQESREVSKKWNLNLSSSSSPCSSTSISSSYYDSEPMNMFKILAKPELLSNPNSIPNSASSSEATEAVVDERVKNIIQEIAATVQRCRARKQKQETWLLFLGEDEEGKLEIGRELSQIVFGRDRFKSVSLEKLAEEVRLNPHCVFFVEDAAEKLHHNKGVKMAMETGRFGETVSLMDAIVIFSSSSSVKQKLDQDQDEAMSSLPLDLNIALHNHHQDQEGTHIMRILDAVDKHIFF